FQRHIACVIVDEAHNIHTAGLSHYGLDAFCPAWGHLDELKAILPHRVHWVFLSATFPPHIRMTVEKKLLQPGYTAIHVTSNRPNTVYAAVVWDMTSSRRPVYHPVHVLTGKMAM
ncbi:hypothetical protein EDB87DRAFT_1567951, partial [Lactarius vividus]